MALELRLSCGEQSGECLSSTILSLRFSDIAKLKRQDVTYESDPSPHLKIVFKGGKNDLYSEGSERIVAANPKTGNCPVNLTLNYFQFLGPMYSGYLDPSCTSKNTPNPEKPVSYSEARNDLKKLMNLLGYDASLYGEHSGKRGGRRRQQLMGQQTNN